MVAKLVCQLATHGQAGALIREGEVCVREALWDGCEGSFFSAQGPRMPVMVLGVRSMQSVLTPQCHSTLPTAI